MADHSIRDALLQAARRFGIDHPLETVAVFDGWERIVGPAVAGRCRPVALKRGVLVVQTSTPAWAAEMRYLGSEVVRRVNAELGRELVRELKVRLVADHQGPQPPPVREAPPGPAPAGGSPTRGQREQAERLAAMIPDERLAEATKRAHLAAKMRKGKGG